MYKSPAYVQNEKRVVSFGYKIVTPDEGMLACGEYGQGRFPDVTLILRAIERELDKANDMQGKRVMVTAGPTREAIDAVRYVSNRSSGKMGYALAQNAVERGADAILVSGPVNQSPVPGAELINTETAEDMARAVQDNLDRTDIFIMAAAVADYSPTVSASHKLKKKNENLSIDFAPTADILQTAAEKKGQRIHVGFALETHNADANARDKLEKKNCDLVVLNRLGDKGAAFDVDTNKVTLFFKDGNEENLPLMSKKMVAEEILNRIIKL
ncbi:MAG: bifunctional phosphopantothenoylcysteine decarboxylase/phosphopantothenate--cysteine ligase CoaBC [candidate division KSB1 bacterium]|nr:bifunctional phosphopantothenoylcysteine decarboxylase/phosphopantothenate--cysteine ligase CoaBC [candidate division KSB1 bacterium]